MFVILIINIQFSLRPKFYFGSGKTLTSKLNYRPDNSGLEELGNVYELKFRFNNTDNNSLLMKTVKSVVCKQIIPKKLTLSIVYQNMYSVPYSNGQL